MKDRARLGEPFSQDDARRINTGRQAGGIVERGTPAPHQSQHPGEKPASYPVPLRLALGARVALTKTQDYKVGTYNGACGTLVVLEYPEGTHSEYLRRTHAQVVNGRTPPVPVALMRFDSIDHKGIDHPEAHTCDEALGANVVPPVPINCALLFYNSGCGFETYPLS